MGLALRLVVGGVWIVAGAGFFDFAGALAGLAAGAGRDSRTTPARTHAAFFSS